MIKNYLLISLRNILRDRVFSAINIGGLALGIAAALLIFQYVSFERSYDRFHTQADRIFRVKQTRYEHGIPATEWAGGAFAVANKMKDVFPEVEDYVKVIKDRPTLLGFGDKLVKTEDCFFAGPQFFSIFSYPLLVGDPATALKEPGTAVLSESTAKNLFGNADPMGQTVQINQKHPVKITGVFKDFPENSHLSADFINAYATFSKLRNPDNDPERDLDNQWNWDGCMSYLLLKPGADPKALEAKFPAFVIQSQPTNPNGEVDVSYALQALTDIHLFSHYMVEAETNGDGRAVYILMGVALFVILIAWLNYINLATARAIRRAREVGVRKVMGSQRSQLVAQFLMESALLNGLAVLSGIALVALVLPLFNNLTDQKLPYSFLLSGQVWATLSALFVGGTLISGAYPAFVLSGFKPIKVLKGGVTAFGEGALLRKSLVVTQFTASIFLLVSTIAVVSQVKFMRSQSLGINLEQTMVVAAPSVGIDSLFARQSAAFKNELKQQSFIKNVTITSTIPGEVVDWNAGGIRLTTEPEEAGKQYRVLAVDRDYIPSFGLKLIAGRGFDPQYNDKAAVVFNKKGIKLLGFDAPEKALGQKIMFWGDEMNIVGVVEDFHQQSLQEAIEPLILRCEPDVRGKICVKSSPGDMPKTIAAVKSAWVTYFPNNPFEYKFLDEQFDKQYRADQRFGKVFGIFAMLAMLVACLGLFGLASFTTAQRTKEIGIRKTLGASVAGITGLLAKDFLKLVLIAIVLASVPAWYFLQRWLSTYAYRIDIQWWMFASAGLAAIVVAALTVSFQSIKAALMNPVKALRAE
jgi:putative ABC transport system permease protein